MINLATKDERQSQAVARVRKLVVAWTTLALGVYLIAAAGFFGWWGFWTIKAKATTKEIQALKAEIVSLSEQEIVMRKLAVRAKSVNDFLGSRENMASEASILQTENLGIAMWEVVPGKPRRVIVAASDSATLKGYEDYMGQFYSDVQVEKASWVEDSGWTLTLLVSGRKSP